MLITDPDHDRLTIAQTESIDRIEELKKLGIDYIKLDNYGNSSLYSKSSTLKDDL